MPLETPILCGKTASFFTLGCKLNFAETSTIGRQLKEVGVELAPDGKPADICIINTCSVTSVADRKDRTLIHRVVRENPNAVVVVMGCYAQLKGDEIVTIPGVDIVVGAGRKSEVVDHLIAYFSGEGTDPVHYAGERLHLHRFENGCSSDDRTRHFLKVQDGCNYGCTYCTIPKARGVSRNGSIASLVAQAEKVADEGGREIVLTGVNIGDFGRSTGETLIDLVRALDQVEGIERYRISSLEPDLISNELIECVAQSRSFMPHWHLPLQSGSDAVLGLMRRRYRTALFSDRLARIKEITPHAFIGVDVIVGMRGETADYFQESLDYLQSQAITQLHVFSYSERSGTPALSIPFVVSPEEKKERSRVFIELSNNKLQDFYAQFEGQTRSVLWEHTCVNDQIYGFTDNYIRLTHSASSIPDLSGRITQATIGKQHSIGLAYCTVL
ncbi:MAG: tRNA (N(6)-L-threonylcarbamoyladenosine(37)-C(2))-methylthiotransferase MtaB [Bacteroidales bacterium]|nr:tRNA (N(6)-L-threonylcarbamoyladenosine(37)-C(2))-methylthiotransferase MtaB [Porphyromonas sp.]MDD6935058.1 tRNA (N(6)-L-threonylcarbamoyladenosine(37)-C(2))-methylthiotransferase MtaB [Bacteroidales bacterium]MDY3102381.1 tRNA (N(6)-L-threonylcarbamoyladenosine(37)-C(2))-methylthiotransferase MtaB [Porphyromonas sp.]